MEMDARKIAKSREDWRRGLSGTRAEGSTEREERENGVYLPTVGVVIEIGGRIDRFSKVNSSRIERSANA